MNTPKSDFLLVGSTFYSNRGCEAIARGTVKILRRAFGEDIHITMASFGTPDSIKQQARDETDAYIEHIPLWHERYSMPWIMHQLNKRAHLRTPGQYWALRQAVRRARVALEVGGDNYSLDYGVPEGFLDMDRFLMGCGVPVVLWGASVGPFENAPEFAPRVFQHLRNLKAIYVREPASHQYLLGHGIGRNVQLVADPAFTLDSVQPSADKLGRFPPDGTIGINFSPLLSRYVGGGGLETWISVCADAVTLIARKTDREILLVPHVFQRDYEPNNDPAFLERVAELVRIRAGIEVSVLPALTAEEIKWAIARCSAFIGARTHATIAAMSSCVPTLSLSYSIKARGINEDVFGSQQYCLRPEEMTPERIATGAVELIEKRDSICERLRCVMPGIIERAYHAGTLLRSVVN